jgi:trigger factor
LNVQTEKLENHIARLTVEIEVARLDKAKKQAARKLAKRVNIPGFRKGRVPYNVLVNYVGEAPILEEAVESLGNDVYRTALEESKVEPYAMGELENFTLDPAPTFIFTVPMQPTVEMNDYLAVRMDYEAPEVKDKDVDDALRHLQEQHAVVEESQSPAALSDKVTMDVSGNFVDDDAEEADDHDHEDEDHDHDHEGEDEDHGHDHNAPIHEHDAEIYLEADREPVPGFADAVVGAAVGDEREFVLTYPDDEEKYQQFAGKVVKFHVAVKKIENVTLPPLNDDFAARVSEEDDDVEEPLTLLALRAKLREDIQTQMEESYQNEYTGKMIDELVEIADFAFADVMVNEQIEDIIQRTASNFGVTLEDYLRLTGQDIETLYEDESLRETAEKGVRRSLVMRGILDAEGITVTEEEIEGEVDRFLTQFGDQAPQYRSLFNTPDMRNSMVNSLLERKIRDRIVEIGRGIERAEPEAAPAVEAEAEAQDEEPKAEADTATSEDAPAPERSEETEASETSEASE